MTRPALVLWGVGTPRTMRAHWALQELGLPYETRAIGPRGSNIQTSGYAALNPRQKIPLLQDGEFTIGESGAIVAYLSRAYPSQDYSLTPAAGQEFASWLEWCFYIVTELDSASLYVMRRHSAKALGNMYGIAPGVVDEAGKYFRKQLKHVEVAFADGRLFLVGDRFSSADILLTSCLEWAIEYGVSLCDNAYPYLERMRARRGYLAAIAANAQPQDQDKLFM